MKAPSVFNLVVRALYLQGGQLLVSRWRGSYAFPVGGRVEMGETLEAALLREFREETGGGAIIRKWVYFHESFYHQARTGEVHELGWYFWVEADRTIGRPGQRLPHPDSERLDLEYVALDQMKALNILPGFLADALPSDLASSFVAAPRHWISHSTGIGGEQTEEVHWPTGGAEGPG
ncbi:MAG: NUDIX domain-containing protein [Anaerolineales bacterium]